MPLNNAEQRQPLGALKLRGHHACSNNYKNGQKEPGAKHFILAALELPDRTARKAFERIHADPDDFAPRSLNSTKMHCNMGIESPEHSVIGNDTVPMPSGTRIYEAQSSAQALMVRQRKTDSNVLLLVLRQISFSGYFDDSLSLREREGVRGIVKCSHTPPHPPLSRGQALSFFRWEKGRMVLYCEQNSLLITA